MLTSNWVILNIFASGNGFRWMGGKTTHHLHPSPKSWGFWLVGFDVWSACFFGRHNNYNNWAPKSVTSYINGGFYITPLRVRYKTAANAHLFQASHRGSKF